MSIEWLGPLRRVRIAVRLGWASLALSLACSSEPALRLVSIDPVRFTCYADGCDVAAGKTARIGALEGHGQPCADVLAATDEETFAAAFLISSTSGDLEQRMSSISKQFSGGWVDGHGRATTVVEDVSVTFCILVEGMGAAPTDARLDSEEVYCQGDLGFAGDGMDHSGNGDDGIADCWTAP